jgi:hypothetical protein
MWHDAEKKKNEYVPTDVHWSEVPGRDEEWKKQTIANTSAEQFKVEFECLSGETNLEIMSDDGKLETITMKKLYERM